MNNRLLFIILIVLLTGCFTHKKYEYELVSQIDGQQQGNIFIDSLKSAKIDSIIGFYYWRGMNGIDNSYYIYWQSKGDAYVTQITQYSNYNIIKNSFFSDAFSPIILQKLKTEKPLIPLSGCDDCRSEQISIFVGTESVTYDVSRQNEWSDKVLFVDKFRSFLFDIHPWEWNAINPKYKKIKRRGGYIRD